MSSSKVIPSPALLPGVPHVSASPLKSGGLDRPTVTGKSVHRSSPGVVDLSVFDILNIFRRRWFLSRTDLVAHAISAQKAEDGNISWVEFAPPYHSHLVKCAVALVPHPVHMVKRVMFVYFLELLNGVGTSAFFDLQKGSRKANNAQKEKRRLARKRSRAAKRERDCEAVKTAKLPSVERQCEVCGRKFNSRKTARKHKCSVTKEASVGEEAAVVPAAQVAPSALPIKPAAGLIPHAPSAPSNSVIRPAVTEGLPDPNQGRVKMVDHAGAFRAVEPEMVQRALAIGWTLPP
jgi:hypothetical protein